MSDSSETRSSENPYVSPAATIKENSEGFRLAPAFAAFASSFIALYSLAFYVYWSTDDMASFSWVLWGLVVSAFSVLTGALFSRFQRMRWYWVVLSAPLLAVTALVVVAISTALISSK